MLRTLVLRNYLEHDVDPADRRRMTTRLAHRGRAAASAVRCGVEDVDSKLAEMCTPAELDGLRAGLGALSGIRELTARR
jgi:DNA-binding MarR family transcriptional regulator